MKVRKKINLFEFILFEYSNNLYNENFKNGNIKESITKIYNKLNDKIIKLQLEDNKEIKDIKYFKVFNYSDGTKAETQMDIISEIISWYFIDAGSSYEKRIDDKEILDELNTIKKEIHKYENKTYYDDEYANLDDEEYFMEIEYED